MEEGDQVKRFGMMVEASRADYFISSISAVDHHGQFIVGDGTGTRVNGFLNAKKVLIVMGSNKIVPTKEDLYKRIEEFCLPLESGRMRVAYKIPASSLNNVLIINGPNPFNPYPPFHFIIVKKSLGY